MLQWLAIEITFLFFRDLSGLGSDLSPIPIYNPAYLLLT